MGKQTKGTTVSATAKNMNMERTVGVSRWVKRGVRLNDSSRVKKIEALVVSDSFSLNLHYLPAKRIPSLPPLPSVIVNTGLLLSRVEVPPRRAAAGSSSLPPSIISPPLPPSSAREEATTMASASSAPSGSISISVKAMDSSVYSFNVSPQVSPWL